MSEQGCRHFVKLTAYDYAIYGGLDGVVTLVSPDTLRDQKRPGDLKLDPNEALLPGTWLPPVQLSDRQEWEKITGYSRHDSQCGYKTGRKTVFQYLIKLITRMKQALQER